MQLTRATLIPAAVLLAVVAGMALTPDVDSGVQVGDFAAPFDVTDVTGPHRGETLCYR